MADRIPLIVDSSSNNLKELPAGDSIILADNEKVKIGTGSDLQIYHDGSHSYLANSTGALKLATETSGIAITIGHSTSETTVADNLTVTGNGTISGTSTFTGLVTASTSANITQVALTSASSVSWDARAAANAFLLLGHNVTFAAPSNAVEGAIISVEIAQPSSGGPYTVAWNTVFEFAASTAPTMTATASKTDIFSFRYNGSVWQEIGRVQNMAQT
jgi:hypothetical protein